MNKNIIITAVLFLGFAACGGGISDDTLLADLDADGWAEVCEGTATDAKSITCTMEDGTEFTIDIEATTDEECASDMDGSIDASCTATVGDVNTCNDAINAMSDEDWCAGTFPSECDFMGDCMAM